MTEIAEIKNATTAARMVFIVGSIQRLEAQCPVRDASRFAGQSVIRWKVANSNGTFGHTTDWWQGHVERQVGASFGRILKRYAVHKATAEARKKGFSVMRQPQRNGPIKLVLLGA